VNLATAGDAAFIVRGHDYQVARLGQDDESLIVSETPFVLLPHPVAPAGTSLKLEIDACGELSSVGSTRSNFTRSGLVDDYDDLDGDDDDPADEGRFLIESWLSRQSELRVINDGVARACGGDDWLDDGDLAESLASLRTSQNFRNARLTTAAIA
jgi:hypothetical protein